MMEKILQLLSVACSHKKISQPFNAAAPAPMRMATSPDWEKVGQRASHYVVCLECGKKFTYDWNSMRIVR